MTRGLLPGGLLASAFLAAALAAQQAPPASQKKPSAPPAKEQEKEDEPPEEDPSLKPKVFSFNPLAAIKNISAGNYYFKKGNYKAARDRYLEATQWNPGSAEAFFKLGETEEKRHDKHAARAAYEKYLELAQDAKGDTKGNDPLRKKIEKWPK